MWCYWVWMLIKKKRKTIKKIFSRFNIDRRSKKKPRSLCGFYFESWSKNTHFCCKWMIKKEKGNIFPRLYLNAPFFHTLSRFPPTGSAPSQLVLPQVLIPGIYGSLGVGGGFGEGGGCHGPIWGPAVEMSFSPQPFLPSRLCTVKLCSHSNGKPFGNRNISTRTAT